MTQLQLWTGEAPRRIAALYVDSSGPYPSQPGVDAWDVARDAKGYAGPYPVVAHPPCGPWGTFSHFCTKQDPELAPLAVEQVRKWGGVLEHPSGSRLWKHCGLWRPGESVSMFSDEWGGWSLQVEQVRWGHKARKKTWLYLVGIPRDIHLVLPPPRAHTHILTSGARAKTGRTMPVLWSDEARATPTAFAEWLLSLARLARRD